MRNRLSVYIVNNEEESLISQKRLPTKNEIGGKIHCPNQSLNPLKKYLPPKIKAQNSSPKNREYQTIPNTVAYWYCLVTL